MHRTDNNAESNEYTSKLDNNDTADTVSSTLNKKNLDEQATKTAHVASNPKSSNSFTQRLIERGVAVPSSFINWDGIKNRSSCYTSSSNNRSNNNNNQDDGISASLSSVSPGAINIHHNNGSSSSDSSSSAHLNSNNFSTATATNNSNSSNGFFYDIEQSYGISPFITPSLTASDLLLPGSEGTTSHSGGSSIPNNSNNNSNNTFFRSLRQRYEKERKQKQQQQLIEGGSNNTYREIDQVNEEDEEDPEEIDGQVQNSAFNAKITNTGKQQDSDIELSEDDGGLQHQQPHPILPLKWRKRTKSTASTHEEMPLEEAAEKNVETENEDKHFTISPTVERVKRLLFTKPAVLPQQQQQKPTAPANLDLSLSSSNLIKEPTASLPSPPRRFLLQTPVFQVVNANTVKDRYLFLFNDLLLICKPIMDENIITTTNISSTELNNRSNMLHINSGKVNIGAGGGNHSPRNGNIVINSSRYRFRPNENSLFQVKNIVQLSNLTLYITKDDYYNLQQQYQNSKKETAADKSKTKAEVGHNSLSVSSQLPPPQPRLKIHPILASALRKFENNASSGIAYLINKKVLTQDSLSIANFLFKTPDLNRRQLGYYLSDPQHEDIYDAFLECFRLSGLKLDEALRILLTTFRLPSNWESLEYLVEKFSKKWHDANQNVIKFHEDMVVKVVVATLFLNAEYWYDAASERDVFWYARELKERQDRHAKRKMSMMVINNHTMSLHPLNKTIIQEDDGNDNDDNNSMGIAMEITGAGSSNNINSTNSKQNVAIEPLHYIMSKRARENQDYNKPSLQEFLERWSYYDQYHLVPEEFMEEMYKSITEERLETGWDNKTGRRSIDKNSSKAAQQEQLLSDSNAGNGVTRPKIVSPSIQQGSQDVVITVTPYRLPSRLTKGMPSHPITIAIPNPDKGLQIKLRGQDLTFKPSNVLDFSEKCTQTFTITGNTLGRTSLMFIKMGENAGNYVSPTLPRTKSVVVERPFMRYTFQIGFKQQQQLPSNPCPSPRKEKSSPGIRSNDERSLLPSMRSDNLEENNSTVVEDDEKDDDAPEESGRRHQIVNRKYTFSVETAEERFQWIDALKKLSGHVNHIRNEETIRQYINMTSEARVALQVLKEILLAENEQLTKRTTATNNTLNATTASNDTSNSNSRNDVYQKYSQTMELLLPSVQRTHMTQQQQQENRNNATASATNTSTVTPTASSTTTANVVTKRGHEIVKLVVQNSMVPLVLGFLKSQI
ncbi:hypothetical protein BDF20DRAFT_852945 [Mycotypha africana]|uniref:uncharacterized protein n=1 Tax=Mycotypha africana TaxID=64632 RepID=UPI002301BAE7|nr:uncharacterized protein BDF20DRAFT_852945 [Mycotypha africana]KAI8987941.1 hypothetical protein BDF20DRAFT_852945 [Mycotypha africana]